jgi:cell division protein FtsA
MIRVLTGIDVGTNKISVLIAELAAEGGITVLGYGVKPCTGVRRGVVANIDVTVEALHAASSEAEKLAGVPIGPAVVNVSGVHIRGLNSHGVVPVHGGEVGPRDIQRVIDAARAVAIPADRQVLHILPQHFAVDEQADVRDPVGMAGVRLEAIIHIITAAQSCTQNLNKCCERAGLTAIDRVFGPLASASAALFPEERELGVALIEIGGGSTGIVIFHNSAVMHTAVLPVGGGHLTNDLAEGLRTPVMEAERLKINYGVATNSAIRRNQVVEITGVAGREARQIERRFLGEILEPRMEEIFALAQQELLRSGVSEHLGSGVVLVGGTALLEGAQELAEHIFNLPVRRGLPINIKNMPEELMKPMYTTAAGLLIHGASSRSSPNLLARFGSWEWLRLRLSEWAKDFL